MARDNLILGTAGHIDHGKTTLVRALTGVDTDRLPEEKARGITIELGFAPLELGPGLRVGVVDVPGHEGLVRTMVSGATGIDLVLLVVAADEGVMPQTREHLAIVDLLAIESGVVALTKADLAEPDVADLAEAEVRDLLAGTSLAKAEVLRVSATTGAGIPELRAALARAAQTAAARTPRSGPARLWVDRCFEARGFGAIVTGTLIGGEIAVGDTLELFPAGARARVRGLQSFGASHEVLAPGARCAVNLHGIALSDLARGMLVAAPDSLAPSQRFDTSLHWLASSAASTARPVACELLVGTAALRAHIAPIGADTFEPGARGFARVHLDAGALALLPGDRFVVRGFSSVATLGGGAILDVAPPQRRRGDPQLAAGLTVLASGGAARGIAVRVARAGFAGIGRDALMRQTGLARETLEAALDAAQASAEIAPLGDGSFVARATLAVSERLLREELTAFHEANAVKPGMPKGTLRGSLPTNAPLALFETGLAALAQRGEIALEGELVRARRVRAAALRARAHARRAAARERARGGARTAHAARMGSGVRGNRGGAARAARAPRARGSAGARAGRAVVRRAQGLRAARAARRAPRGPRRNRNRGLQGPDRYHPQVRRPPNGALRHRAPDRAPRRSAHPKAPPQVTTPGTFILAGDLRDSPAPQPGARGTPQHCGVRHPQAKRHLARGQAVHRHRRVRDLRACPARFPPPRAADDRFARNAERPRGALDLGLELRQPERRERGALSLRRLHPPLAHEAPQFAPRFGDALTKDGERSAPIEHARRVLRGELRVARPLVRIECSQARDELRGERICVHVANRISQVSVALDRARLVAILEEMPDSLVAAVEVQRVTGCDARHRDCERDRAGSRNDVNVIGHEREGQKRQAALPRNARHAREETRAV